MTVSEAFDETLKKLDGKEISREEALARICQTFLANQGGYRIQADLRDIKWELQKDSNQ